MMPPKTAIRQGIRWLNESLQYLERMYSQSGNANQDVSDDVRAIMQKLEELSNDLMTAMGSDCIAHQLSFTFRKSYCE